MHPDPGQADRIRADQVSQSGYPAVFNNYIVFIDEVEGVNRRITDEAGGRVCNPKISPRHRDDK